VTVAADWALRPMADTDAAAAAEVVLAADTALQRALGRPVRERTAAERDEYVAALARAPRRDPDGAFVAVAGDVVVGMAQAIRRGPFWGLSMLFVHPAWQDQRIGRALLGAARQSAFGATVEMILTSMDHRALRRYSQAGLAIHPTVMAAGVADRRAIPTGLPGRPGSHADLDLVEAVDEGLRGSRAEDVAFLLDAGEQLEVVDRAAGRGYAVHHRGTLRLLGADDEETAAAVLWRVLAATTGEFSMHHLTAAQDWAVRVALDARLPVTPSGPLFVRGRPHPPGPWVPSGWYF
jgi:GNAT superfamily N-acetyltransferase